MTSVHDGSEAQESMQSWNDVIARLRIVDGAVWKIMKTLPLGAT
jgi:hypothetical protein